jgi:hypothetical protein
VGAKCGRNLGYGWLKKPTEASGSFINSSIVNRSHDLRLLFYVAKEYHRIKATLNINRFVPSGAIPDEIYTLPNLVDSFFDEGLKYGNPASKHAYGKKEEAAAFPQLKTVKDAYKFLRLICSTCGFIEHNNHVYNDATKKLGDLHIYSDGRDMVFSN